MFKTPVDDYRELCYLIYWGRASVILEILLTNQYNGMIDGFEHCSIVDHVSEEVRYVFFPSGHLSIGRYCGWNLDVVPLQSDEKRWYEVYQPLLLEFRKDAKWIKKTL